MSLVPYSMPVVAATASTPRKGKRSKPRNSARPPVNALRYRGPLRLPASAQQNDLYTTQVNIIGTVTSSGTGVINTVFDSQSQVSTSTDFTSLTNIYTEFRVLSMDIEFMPYNKYNLPTTTVAAPVYSVVSRDTATALPSLSATSGYDSLKGHEPSTRFKRSVKMDGVDESTWVPVGSSPASTARMYIKLYSAGNSNSTNYYDFIDRIMVQFRGRQ